MAPILIDVPPRLAVPLSLFVCVSLAAAQGPGAPEQAKEPGKVDGRTAAQAVAGMGRSSSGETQQAVARVLDANVLPANRAEMLRALGTRAAATPNEHTMVRDAATRVLDSGITEIRTAAAEALGSTGPEAVAALTRAMSDYHYQVRAAAATSLERVARSAGRGAGAGAGSPALPAAAALAAALDPYLGAAAQAGAALMAIGPEALPIVEARFKASSPADRARPVLVAVMLSLRHGRDHLADTLEKELPRGPNGEGFVSVEPLRTTASGTPYEPSRHRIRASFTVLHYGSPRKLPLDMQETSLVAWQSVNAGLAALAGRRAGDRVRLLMSPDIAQSLVFGTSTHQTMSRTHVSGTTGYFDVTIDRVCEPQIWTLFGGGGIFGPLKFETSCRD